MLNVEVTLHFVNDEGVTRFENVVLDPHDLVVFDEHDVATCVSIEDAAFDLWAESGASGFSLTLDGVTESYGLTSKVA